LSQAPDLFAIKKEHGITISVGFNGRQTCTRNARPAADEQHRRRMDLFALLREDNLPGNDSRMNDEMTQDEANNQLAEK
jgi:hypothetical protein